MFPQRQHVFSEKTCVKANTFEAYVGTVYAWQGPWGDEAFESTEQEAFEDVPGYNRCASPARVRVATGS